MTSKTLKVITVATLAVIFSIMAIACGNSDAGLTRSDVEGIVRAEMANAPPRNPDLPVKKSLRLRRPQSSLLPPTSSPQRMSRG